MSNYKQRFFKYWEENKPKNYKGNFISFKDFKNDMEKFLNINWNYHAKNLNK